MVTFLGNTADIICPSPQKPLEEIASITEEENNLVFCYPDNA